METVTILVVTLTLLVFAGLVIISITASRREIQAREQMAQTLGMTPVTPDETLLAQISALYQTPGNKPRHSLHNVTRRLLPDGELFLFDLVDRDIESNSWIENQAVAIRSDTLRLPPFQLYPKVNTQKYALGNLANRIVEWGASKVGTVVQFPEFPDLQERYSISSTDPEATRRFFDEEKALFFAHTEYYGLHAGGNLMTFAEMEPGIKTSDPAHITRRINRALEIYRLFQK
ncbi:MAG: hypothetical protein ACOY16_09760 [Chloroflexota bacterium]